MIETAHMWAGDMWGWIGALTALAFLVLVVLAIAVLLRSDVGRPERTGGSTALRLLEERYARGEISREEFVERRAVLTTEPPEA